MIHRKLLKKYSIQTLVMILTAGCLTLNGCQKKQDTTIKTDTSETSSSQTASTSLSKEANTSSDSSTVSVPQLTKEEKLEDFESLYETIRDNYAFLEVNKRMHGVDWLANKSMYEDRISRTKSDVEFFKQLSSIITDLSNWHTCMLNRDGVLSFGNMYKSGKDNGEWIGLNYDELCKPEVLKRYDVTINDYESGNETYYDGDYKADNLSVGDIVEGKVACITIPELVDISQIDNDAKLVKNYLQKVKDYPSIVIDIRGNSGGDSRYYTDFLYPLIVPETMESDCYLFYKDSPLFQKILAINTKLGWDYKMIQDMDLSQIPNLMPEVEEKFTYCNIWDVVVKPNKDSIHYHGNVYLLVDHNVYSSAEMMSIWSKDTGFATLIGEKTGGDGPGSDPVIVALPNSGYAYRFSIDYGTSLNGDCDEETKTQPDYEVNAKQTGDPSTDECYQKVLELEGLK